MHTKTELLAALNDSNKQTVAAGSQSAQQQLQQCARACEQLNNTEHTQLAAFIKQSGVFVVVAIIEMLLSFIYLFYCVAEKFAAENEVCIEQLSNELSTLQTSTEAQMNKMHTQSTEHMHSNIALVDSLAGCTHC